MDRNYENNKTTIEAYGKIVHVHKSYYFEFSEPVEIITHNHGPETANKFILRRLGIYDTPSEITPQKYTMPQVGVEGLYKIIIDAPMVGPEIDKITKVG